jgi:hypothetical protein
MFVEFAPRADPGLEKRGEFGRVHGRIAAMRNPGPGARKEKVRRA